MRPNLHPRLVNGRFGDPGLFVEMLHRREALLIDLGDLSALPPRDLLRVGHVLVTHAHIDHFVGFDALLRVSVGREKRIEMIGPPGFADRVGHRLLAYEWDLVDRYATDLVFDVTELHPGGRAVAARFRFKARFAREDLGAPACPDGIVARDDGFEVRAALLDHHGFCLGFAVAEPVHVNVWKNRLEALGLPPGQWLQALKRAVAEGAGDDAAIDVPGRGAMALAGLRDLVSLSPGQKIAYVTDVADSPANRAAIRRLVEGADLLFIESRFAAADEAQAQARAHLTTRAAGEIGRAAGVRRIEPFHFSPRYDGEESRMVEEVQAAFRGAPAQG